MNSSLLAMGDAVKWECASCLVGAEPTTCTRTRPAAPLPDPNLSSSPIPIDTIRPSSTLAIRSQDERTNAQARERVGRVVSELRAKTANRQSNQPGTNPRSVQSGGQQTPYLSRSHYKFLGVELAREHCNIDVSNNESEQHNIDSNRSSRRGLQDQNRRSVSLRPNVKAVSMVHPSYCRDRDRRFPRARGRLRHGRCGRGRAST